MLHAWYLYFIHQSCCFQTQSALCYAITFCITGADQYVAHTSAVCVHPGEASGRFELTWAVLEEWRLPAFIISSLQTLPKLVTSADTVPPYHHKFALNMLAVLASHENIFTHLQAQHQEVSLCISGQYHCSQYHSITVSLQFCPVCLCLERHIFFSNIHFSFWSGNLVKQWFTIFA